MGAGAAKEERRQQVKKNVQTMGKVSKKRAKPGGTIQGPKILALISRFRLVNHKSVSTGRYYSVKYDCTCKRKFICNYGVANV